MPCSSVQRLYTFVVFCGLGKPGKSKPGQGISLRVPCLFFLQQIDEDVFHLDPGFLSIPSLFYLVGCIISFYITTCQDPRFLEPGERVDRRGPGAVIWL